MITRVRSAGIFCRDQKAAKDFWTDTMGFDLVQDSPMDPDDPDSGLRWIEVRAPGDDTILVLFTPEGDEGRIGQFSNLIFECDDVQKTYEDLSSKGVEFPTKPEKQFWGWWAMFQDNEGNSYGLGEQGQ
jgi:catechol 2,3-dioxygenase-like lactoylglutathione lyase family enzyme